MKKLIMSLVLLVSLNGMAKTDYGMLLGVGYDNHSYQNAGVGLDSGVLQIHINPVATVTFLEMGPKYITGFTLTSDNGIFVNVGFKF